MRIATTRDLGLRLRDRRRQLGLSQAQLGDTIGTTRQWVIALEQGKPTVPLGHVLRAIAALGLVADIRDEPLPEAQEAHTSSRDASRQAGPASAATLDAIITRARQFKYRTPSRGTSRKGAGRKRTVGKRDEATAVAEPFPTWSRGTRTPAREGNADRDASWTIDRRLFTTPLPLQSGGRAPKSSSTAGDRKSSARSRS